MTNQQNQQDKQNKRNKPQKAIRGVANVGASKSSSTIRSTTRSRATAAQATPVVKTRAVTGRNP